MRDIVPQGFGTNKIFALRPGATVADVCNTMAVKLQQADSILGSAIGGGFEAWDELSAKDKDAFLWGVQAMVKEARELLGCLHVGDLVLETNLDDPAQRRKS